MYHDRRSVSEAVLKGIRKYDEQFHIEISARRAILKAQEIVSETEYVYDVLNNIFKINE